MSQRVSWLVALAALTAITACMRQEPLPAPSMGHAGTGASPRTVSATAASETMTPALGVAAGPRSPLGYFDLPAGVVYVGASSDEERWVFASSYDGAVAFLRRQFGAGPTVDAQGATSWRDLPPCYDDAHRGPPAGWVTPHSTRWVWADDDIALSVAVNRPVGPGDPNEIVVDYERRDNSYVCYSS